jgi:hypothetical protein
MRFCRSLVQPAQNVSSDARLSAGDDESTRVFLLCCEVGTGHVTNVCFWH